MCCVRFIIKYVLFFANLIFSLAGLALAGVGIAVLLQFSETVDVLPMEAINMVPITVIVVGCVIFLIAFLGCCGAIKENCCMLVMYSIIMAILAGVKIWICVVITRNLNDLMNLVTDWLTPAFNNSLALPERPFSVLEEAFQCCGTTGVDSYGLYEISPTCCDEEVCTISNSFEGCINVFSDYLETFGSAVGVVLVIIIIVEIVAVIFGLCMAWQSVQNKKRID